MAGPWDDYATPDNVAALVTSEATRQGVDPALALRVAHQESRLNPAAVSPKGALGVMQLMPETARGMGVDPTDLGDNIRGGVSYLKQQMDTFGDPKLAAAAYNAGPEAVRKHGGVPPYAETQHYVQAVAPGDDQPETPPWLDYGSVPAAAPTAAAAPTKPKAPPMLPAAAARPNVMADVGKSYGTGVKQGGLGLADQIAAMIPGLNIIHRAGSDIANVATHQTPGATPDLFSHIASMLLPDHAPQTWQGRTALTAGQMTPAAFGGEGSTLARVANVVVPTAASSAAGETARAMHASPMVEQIARTGGAIGGGALASLRLAPRTQRVPIADQVGAARDEAYARVRAAGDTIPQSDVRDLANSVTALVQNTAGPDGRAAYPASHAMAARLRQMAQSRDGITLPQMDTLRSDIYDALIRPGDREAPVGAAIRQQIDGTIANLNNPDILAARDLHTRAVKIGAIQDEVRSAQLRASAANSGQNVNNSIRQELRPLIDPTRNQQITNFTPEEMAALERAVSGTPTQNLTRNASNLLRNRFLQGAVMTPTLGTGTVAMDVAGNLLRRLGERQTVGNVNRVIDMIAAGHQGSAAPPVVTPPMPLLAAPNTGAIPIAALLSALPLAATARTAKKPAMPQRR